MNKKVKVLHIFGVMNRGGAETLIFNLMRNINRDKFQFDFLVHTNIEGHYDQDIIDMGGEIHHIERPRKSIFKYKNNIKRVLQTNGPYDVIHSHLYSFSGIIMKIAKDLNVPVRIAHSHSTQDGKSKGLFREMYKRYMRKLILDNSTKLLGCSNDACISLFGKENFDDSRVQIFKNAIDLNLFSTDLGNEWNLRQELNLGKNAKVIGHVGSFRKVKNHEYLLSVFKELSLRDNNFHLILVGDGILKQEITKLIKHYNLEDRIHMLGIRKDVPNLLKQIDLFLFPSLFEGLGIAVIEAQASGTMCVIADTIPKEVDLNLGLVKYVSLQNDEQIWSSIVRENIHKRESNWSNILKKINANGYNIKIQSEVISRIYKG